MFNDPSRFDSESPVPPEVLARILEQAVLAPSPYNLQPWRFIVVRDAAARRRLQTFARNQPLVGQAPVVVVVLAYHDAVDTHLDAALARRLELGACSPGRAAEIKGRATAALGRLADRSHWATRSSLRAAAALTHAAQAAGVSTLILDDLDLEVEALRAWLGVPDDHSVCCLVALGRAVESEPFPGRFELGEVCWSEHFGQPWTG